MNFSGKEGHPNIQPSTRPGIEPGTSGLGGRDLNHCAKNKTGKAKCLTSRLVFLACVTCRRMLSKVKRMKYSASFKLQVVKFASDNSNNSAASRKFGIDEKLVRDWRRKIDNIKSLLKTKCADRGRKCQWPELEKKVVEWVEENRKSGLAVRRNLIRLHAKKTAQQMNIDNFLVSSGCCTRFMKRNKPVLHQKTKISQCGISNTLDGTEDDLVWEEEEDSSQVEEEPDCDVYDDKITPEQWQELFGESNDEEEFHGF